ncbi:unnamed protein product [Tetraodon nigroviridis]|uniref:(spotted green pufferfish) hypothetical protein n=1 Tax=Tetraodon nigroviridis TaxID=99883 RepID=Q4RAQ8_TETNG|nr:unnamed protein product [Tetraodon nigroviridis]
MAETKQHCDKNGAFKDSGDMASYGECVCAMLKLLPHFGKEVC